jgi:hypothetical protein
VSKGEAKQVWTVWGGRVSEGVGGERGTFYICIKIAQWNPSKTIKRQGKAGEQEREGGKKREI